MDVFLGYTTVDDFYNTRKLTVMQKKAICRWAKSVCYSWWVDILDCTKSFARQKIDMSFTEILKKLKRSGHFVIIHRRDIVRYTDEAEYIEIGFSTMRSPDYFLWILLNTKYLPELKLRLERCSTLSTL
jgi:hypothetical protein